MDMDWVEETKERVGKLGCYVNQDAMMGLLQNYIVENDPALKNDLRTEIDSILNIYEPRLWSSDRPVIEAPQQHDVNGDIQIGTIYQGDVPSGDFMIDKRLMVRHCELVAQTGHAKSTVIYHMQDQLIRDRIPFIFFDMKKDGRALLPRFKELAVLPWYHFHWNPLRPPPGMPIETWWANLSQICGFSFGWFVASSNYLQQHLDNLHEHYKETNVLPTLENLYASIAQTTESSRRKSEYHDSVENRINTLVSIFGSNLDVEVGIPLEKVCELPCIIELHGLRPAEANWIVEVILSWIYFYHLYQDQRGEELRQVIFVDECHRIFDKSKEYRQTAIEMGTPIISIFPSQFRDFGISLVMSSQTPSQIMNVVHANTVVKLVGNLSSGLDIEAVSDAMGLDDETTACIHKLKRAQWIVRMSDGYTEPFLIETPDYPVERTVSDEEVIGRLESIFSEHITRKEEEVTKEKTKPEIILPQLSDDGWALLFDINTHPFRGLTGRYRALGLSGRRASSAKKELLGKRLASEVSVVLGSYRPVKFLVLTNQAINTLRNIGHDVRLWRHTGHMGFHHQLYTVLIGYSYKKKNCPTYIEKTLENGRRVDVLTIVDGRKIAIEVELGAGIDIQTKATALDEVDELVIVTDEKMNLGLRSKLPERVKLFHVADYLHILKSNYNMEVRGNNPINQKKAGLTSESRDKDGNKGNEQIG